MEELLDLDCEEVKEEKLTVEDINRYLSVLNGWHLEGKDSIVKTFRFESFSETIEFVNSVANVAESENHHPDMDIRFNVVTLTLSTHDASGLTWCDLIIAARINTLIQIK